MARCLHLLLPALTAVVLLHAQLAAGVAAGQLRGAPRAKTYHISAVSKRTHVERRRAILQAALGGGHAQLSLQDALAQLPVRVGELLVEVKQGAAPDAALDLLNEAYGHALSDNDTLSFKCADREAEGGQKLDAAQGGFKQADRALKELQGRVFSLQEAIDNTNAELQSLRDQFASHRAECQRNQQRGTEALEMLGKDLPVAKALVEAAEGPCGSGQAPPRLIECSLPDGSFVVTFQEQALRDQVIQLSSLSERLLASRLDQTVHSMATASGSGAAALLQEDVRRQAQTPQPVSLLELSQHSQHRLKRQIPEHFCAAAVAPTCESLSDNLASFVGGVGDLVDELKAQAQTELAKCHTSLGTYTVRIDSLKRESEDASTALSDAVAQQPDVVAWQRERHRQLRELGAEARRGREDCDAELLGSQGTLCGARRIFVQLEADANTALGGFMGDCEVSEWAAENCSEPCGHGGTQRLTREVVKAPDANRVCPDLEITRACNEKPCPIDAEMSPWQEWSECSRACGGGTRTRLRSVVKQAEHGGMMAGETVEEQHCNVYPCDEECVLAEWSDWSNCSKACMGGHRTRERKVLRQALGSGSCPEEQAAARRQAVVCNRKRCRADPAPQCASVLDLALVLDASGSMGSEGLKKAKSFVQAVAERTKFGDGDAAAGTPPFARVGAIAFANEASVLQVPTTDGSELSNSLESVAWAKTKTNTGEAVAAAAEMLEQYRRNQAQQAILVVTDGMPISSYVLSVEAARLRERGVRLAFVLIGATLSKGPFEGWASWPPEENVLALRSFEALQEEATVTEMLANLCPVLA